MGGPPTTRRRTRNEQDASRDSESSLPAFTLGVRDDHFTADPTAQAESASFANLAEASLAGRFRALEMRLAELKDERQADSNLRAEVNIGLTQLKGEVFQELGAVKTDLAVLRSDLETHMPNLS